MKSCVESWLVLVKAVCVSYQSTDESSFLYQSVYIIRNVQFKYNAF